MKLLGSSTGDTWALHKYRECVLKNFVPVQFKYYMHIQLFLLHSKNLCAFKDIWDKSYLYDLRHKTNSKIEMVNAFTKSF